MKEIKTIRNIEKEKWEKINKEKLGKRGLLILIKSIEAGINKGYFKEYDEEEMKKKIIEFLCNKDFKGMFLDEYNEVITREYLEDKEAKEIINEFKKGMKEFKEFVKEME